MSERHLKVVKLTVWQEHEMAEANINKIINNLIDRTRKRCKKTGLSFHIKVGVLYKLWNEQDGCCAVTGLPFANPNGNRHPFAPSIDRINNAMGYFEDNIRLVCLIVNMGVFTWGLSYFDQAAISRTMLLMRTDKDLCAALKEKLITDVKIKEFTDSFDEKPQIGDDLSISEGTCQGRLHLPSNWFYARRKLGLSLPKPCEIRDCANGVKRRRYKVDDVLKWFTLFPEAKSFDPNAVLAEMRKQETADRRKQLNGGSNILIAKI